jgi:hypothetical protein
MDKSISYVWDGEKIKQTYPQIEKDLTPKDILNGLANVRNQIHQAEGSKEQLKRQMKKVDVDIVDMKKAEKELRELEPRCIEIQVEKLKSIVNSITSDCRAKAEDNAKKTIEKSPDAYTEEQKNNLLYVEFQKLLATNEKVAERISNQIITKHLYEEPFFKNPFL